MPLVAYLGNRGNVDLSALCKQLIEVNRLPNVDQQVETFVDEHVCIVVSSVSTQSKLQVTDRYIIALEGDILNAPPPTELATKVAAHDSSFLSALNGNFNLYVYDRIQHESHVVNCKASRYNFYYGRILDGVVTSSNLRSIVRVTERSPQLDSLSAFKVLTVGYVFGDSTMIQGVRRFPPATVARVSASQVQSLTYWKPVFGNYSKWNIKDVVNEFNSLLVDAARIRFDYFKEITVFLSGGMDSRLIAAAAERAGVSAKTITYGVPGSRDLAYAKILAEKLGMPNVQYIVPGGVYRYSDYLSLLAWLTEGSSPLHPLTSTQLHPFFIKNQIRNYSHGSTLPILSSYLFYPFAFMPINETKKKERAFEHISKGGTTLFEAMKPEFRNEHRLLAEKEFDASFDEVSGQHFADRFISWYFLHRETRSTYNSSSVNGYYFNDIHFFADSKLLDFYFRVPMRFRFEQLYQRIACSTLNPKIKDVPCTATATKIYPSLTAALLERVNDKWFGGARKAKHKDSRTDVLKDEKLRDYLSNAAGSGVVSTIFDENAVRQLIDEHYGNQRDRTRELLAIASVSKFQELFLEKKCDMLPQDAAAILDNVPYQPLGDSKATMA